ncbi:alpha/beta hydrolase fold family protein [Janthinobacterium agaricidamnosum NBRC 102515 = DSM 9628]|uniref:Alpha/beta hydrolase fold family protein n=2 Tax=Janthinobacterium agaricidamnosum TaxID=55508 RepID=W0V365_9BURK|nr:alpha/beta hydrolase [Janthinobacterium agaricidamnosum]CDG81717.1 alpha/beta hydrolase fold family protein [Janthinobacterium agaricidamnosum NBRC 102515 = DSM 9628]
MLTTLRPIICALLLTGLLPASHAAERWQTLPDTPAPIAAERSGKARVNGIDLYYAVAGKGAPVILLHGGPANSDYWSGLATALKKDHTVILVDSRGHGRSSDDSRPLSYDRMADDVVQLMNHLKIAKADIVGWSDGANVGLDIALRHAARVGKIVAFGGNTNTSGTIADADKNPNFAAFLARAEQEYIKLKKTTPQSYAAFVEKISVMWGGQPNWTDQQLASIKSKVLVMDGDHDEAIKLEHTKYIAAKIPGAKLVILPNTSHFAFLQDPVAFNDTVRAFLAN